MRATHGLHRIQLKEAHAVNHPAEVPDVDPPGRTRIGETLGG
jgi:hypothetical protein